MIFDDDLEMDYVDFFDFEDDLFDYDIWKIDDEYKFEFIWEFMEEIKMFFNN